MLETCMYLNWIGKNKEEKVQKGKNLRRIISRRYSCTNAMLEHNARII